MGSPRRAVALEKRGYKVSRPSVARMMKALGVEARRTRKGIGGALSADMTAENTKINAWYAAVANRPINQQLICHSDRASQ